MITFTKKAVPGAVPDKVVEKKEEHIRKSTVTDREDDTAGSPAKRGRHAAEKTRLL